MHVVVLGAGSLGSLVAGRLAAVSNGDADGELAVTLLGREGDHLQRIRERGLRLTRPDGREETVALDVSTDYEIGADADVLVVLVKSYDTADAMAAVAPHLGDAAVLTLQNGLGNAETIAEYVPAARVVEGTTSHGAVLDGAGHVRHAGTGQTTIGRWVGENDARVTALADALTTAGVETTVTGDPERAVWTKVLVNAGINAATALARVPNGALVEQDSGERLLCRAVEEGEAVARACGVAVPDDVVERTRAVAERTATNRSSMRQDLERGQRTEVESLNGELARRADEHGVQAPVNETLADLLRLTESA
jgi:2-dehydropantoate 2-reductase